MLNPLIIGCDKSSPPETKRVHIRSTQQISTHRRLPLCSVHSNTRIHIPLVRSSINVNAYINLFKLSYLERVGSKKFSTKMKKSKLKTWEMHKSYCNPPQCVEQHIFIMGWSIIALSSTLLSQQRAKLRAYFSLVSELRLEHLTLGAN